MSLTRSRAAVLCFGGWGLQTMLHLWPRLRFIQEERAAQGGAAAKLPDLTRLAAFAAIMPWSSADSTEDGNQRPFTLWRPKPGYYPDPFYADRVVQQALDDLKRRRGPGVQSSMFAEELARVVLRRATDSATTYLERLNVRTTNASFGSGDRPRRRDVFRATIADSEAAVRAIIQNVIDPTRLDALQARDPWVQTSLYVVASMAEPLTSALIWPILAELTATLGERSVVNVVGIFSTGSFASDDTRPVEEALGHMALRELCALSGLSGLQPSLGGLAQMVGEKLNWENRLGKSLFNHIYLLDREKSNQALARDSLELAVLAGNAIETFLVADGGMFLEERLGADSFANQGSPFGLIGAASDYVPLSAYVSAAIEEERKRLIREVVLGYPPDSAAPDLAGDDSLYDSAADSDAPEDVGAAPRSPWFGRREDDLTPPRLDARYGKLLGDLRIQLSATVDDLLRPGLRRMFERAPTPLLLRIERRLPFGPGRALDPTSWDALERLATLRFSRSFLLDASILEDLRRTRSQSEWRETIQAHFSRQANNLDAAIHEIRLDEVWGLSYDAHQVGPEAAGRELDALAEQTWAQRRQVDQRRLPAALYRVLHATVRTMAGLPDQSGSAGRNGLHAARNGIQKWAGETGDLLDQLNKMGPRLNPPEREEAYAERFRTWWTAFTNHAVAQPRAEAILVRMLLGGGLLLYVGLGWLLNEAPPTLRPPLLPLPLFALIVLGLAGLAALITGFPGLINRLRGAQLRRRRVMLAQEQLTALVQSLVLRSLRELYERLRRDLLTFRDTLDEAISNLEVRTKPEDPPSVPPAGLEEIHLRRAHTSAAAWYRIRDLVKQEKNEARENGEQRLKRLWRQRSTMRNWDQPLRQPDSDARLPQWFRLALEASFNSVEWQNVIPLEVARRNAAQPDGSTTQQADPDEVRRQAEAGEWCPYGKPRNDQSHAAYCTACPDPGSGMTCLLRVREEIVDAAPTYGAQLPDGPGARLLVETIEKIASEAVGHLAPDKGRRVMPNRPDFIGQLVREYNLERVLLLGDEMTVSADDSESPLVKEALRDTFVEDLYARAKPSAAFEPVRLGDTNCQQIDYAVTSYGSRSVLRNEFSLRNIPLLASEDQMSMSVVCTVNNLDWQDLRALERLAHEYQRLSSHDRDRLALPSDKAQQAELYGEPSSDVVSYEPVID